MCYAIVPNIQCRFYFHLAHLRKEDQRYLDPALNAKLDRVPCRIVLYLGKIDDKGGYMEGDVVRVSYVLVCRWCLCRERFGTTDEGSWVTGRSRPAMPRTSLQRKPR